MQGIVKICVSELSPVGLDTHTSTRSPLVMTAAGAPFIVTIGRVCVCIASLSVGLRLLSTLSVIIPNPPSLSLVLLPLGVFLCRPRTQEVRGDDDDKHFHTSNPIGYYPQTQPHTNAQAEPESNDRPEVRAPLGRNSLSLFITVAESPTCQTTGTALTVRLCPTPLWGPRHQQQSTRRYVLTR
jgi:hypothetical protein